MVKSRKNDGLKMNYQDWSSRDFNLREDLIDILGTIVNSV